MPPGLNGRAHVLDVLTPFWMKKYDIYQNHEQSSFIPNLKKRLKISDLFLKNYSKCCVSITFKQPISYSIFFSISARQSKSYSSSFNCLQISCSILLQSFYLRCHGFMIKVLPMCSTIAMTFCLCESGTWTPSWLDPVENSADKNSGTQKMRMWRR